MDSALLTRQIKEHALRLGFDAVGAAPAAALPAENLREWLKRGYHGQMGYMERNVEKRLDPGLALEGARSIVSLALNYYHPYTLPYDDPDCGVVSRYASGDDYHEVLKRKLDQLLEYVQTKAPGTRGKTYVDTGPVLDKYWASRSGIGWLGKNGNVLAKRRTGSWFFLGELLLDVELEYDQPHLDHCGSCTRCLEACPTDAIVEPRVVDSRRCISYLTIELKGDIAEELRSAMANLVYGCDICQDVCPWNRKLQESGVQEFRPRDTLRAPRLRELARMTPDDFRVRFKRSAVKRAKWEGMMRNVAVALGNSRDPEAVPELEALLAAAAPVVRRHAAWALGKIGGERARQALRARLTKESDTTTRAEIGRALSDRSDGSDGSDRSDGSDGGLGKL